MIENKQKQAKKTSYKVSDLKIKKGFKILPTFKIAIPTLGKVKEKSKNRSRCK